MRIQHNIMAMNAYRNLGLNQSALSKNLEKLSSGYKINRAGDDAAGLAISEKMRAQITGLDAAQKNVKDGISLVKTAEGALQEVHDMLGRMKYLATQSANGTYQDEVDRENLQKEVDSLRSEINRIADSANFNGQKLLDGSLGEALTPGTPGLRDPANLLGASDITKVHQKGNTTEVQPKFTIDLSNLDYKQATTGEDTTLSITINGQTFTISTAVRDKDANATAIASAIKDKINSATHTVGGANYKGLKVTVDGQDYIFKASAAAGKLTFTLASSTQGAKQQTISSDFTPSIEVSNVTMGGNKHGTFTGGDKVNAGSLTITGAVAIKDANWATASFKLTMEDLADQNEIVIGDQTFKVFYDKTKANAYGGQAIDLSKFVDQKTGKIEAGKEKDAVAEAIAQITVKGATNSVFTIGSNAQVGKADTITLLEKKTNADNFDNGVAGAVDLSTKEDIMKQVQIKRWAGNGLTDAEQKIRPLSLQIGDTSDGFNSMEVKIESMKTASLGIDSVDITTADGAHNSIDMIMKAINTVSSTRGDLGAIQNRLEHTSNNLGVMKENIQDAESTIRDTDVADEMMKYTKNNILIQASQAMLAQANQVPQGVLQLLQ